MNNIANQMTFHYYNQDHLGNNREVVNENGTIEQVTNYYPFGAPYCDNTNTNADLQPYKYNGKELDLTHGLNTYDYGARQYNSIVPSWTSVDPLAEKYYNISPYVYCGNNPENIIDINGDSLTLDGSEAAKQTAMNIYNDGLGGFYKTTMDKNNSVTLSHVEGKDISKMTSSQKAVYDKLNTIIEDKKTTTIKVVSNSEDVLIGDIAKNTMDVGDMSAIKDKKAITSVSAIMHETYENYLVQVKETNIYSAHASASNLEAHITGYFIHPKRREMRPMKLDLTVSYPKVEKIIIKLKNGNIDE